MSRLSLILVLCDLEGDVHRHVAALSGAGFETTLLSSPEELLETAIRNRPALIIIDTQKLDWQFVRTLRADLRAPHIPIIALYPGHLTPSETKQSGCDIVLPKPCSADELLFAIETISVPASRRTVRPPQSSQ